jgi:DNA polymerase (family 10)
MGLKLNEYGLFMRDSGKMVASATEEEVYKVLGFPYIEPELREMTGEIEAARAGKLPKLVEQGDVMGDLHLHTDWSDGRDAISDVIAAAISRGYEFVAVTDHSQSLKITNGLTPERLTKQIGAVRKAEGEAGGKISVLAGSEVDIKPDGSLDYPASLLEDLDIVIGSVHSRFKMDKKQMTERIIRAIGSGMIDILGHPSGRIIGQRKPYEFDLEAVLDSARDSGVCMEINSFPDRLDLCDRDCKSAKQSGVKVAVGTDSHSIEHMWYMELGVITARRGWLEKEDVINTLNRRDLGKWLGERR